MSKMTAFGQSASETSSGDEVSFTRFQLNQLLAVHEQACREIVTTDYAIITGVSQSASFSLLRKDDEGETLRELKVVKAHNQNYRAMGFTVYNDEKPVFSSESIIDTVKQLKVLVFGAQPVLLHPTR